MIFAGGRYRGTNAPGSCIMRDKAYDPADRLSDCSAFVIVSRLLYGGFSIPVKALFRGAPFLKI